MRKTNLSVGLTVVLGIFPLFGCQSTQTEVVSAPEVLAEFQIQGGMNHIVLPVTFQGKEYPFVLDTGSMDTVFDESFKDKLGKRFMWPLRGRGPEGKKFKIEYYLGHHPFLGPLALDEDSSLVRTCELDKLVAAEKRDFQGIIGMEFLAKYIVQIDFDNNKVTFFKGKKNRDMLSFRRAEENRHPEWGEPIPLRKKPLRNIRYVKGTVSGNVEVDFLVDTGWLSFDSLKGSVFDRLYSQKYPDDESGGKSSSSILQSYSIIDQMGDFSVGSLDYENHVFRRSNESVLGLAFWQRHLVTLDFANNRMYLKRGNNFDQRPTILISIERLRCKVNAESLVVVEVDPNGPAYEKGIRERDILTKINAQDVSSLSIAQFMRFMTQLSPPRNGEVSCTFAHDNEMITVPFGGSAVDANKN